MTVAQFCLFNAEGNCVFSDVEGTTYRPVGEVSLFEKNGGAFTQMKNMTNFAACMAFNNESNIRKNREDPESDQVVRTGLPTEAALKVLTEKFNRYDKSNAWKKFQSANNDPDDLEAYNKFVMSRNNQEKLATLAFSRDRKRMSVLCSDGSNSGKNILYVKGAPDYMLADKNCMFMDSEGNVQKLNAQARQNIVSA